MPVRYEDNIAILDGPCAVEDAGDFASWLLEDRARGVDLAPCTALHTAFFQTLAALRPPLHAMPLDPHLGRWLTPLLPAAICPPAPAAKAKPPAKPKTARPPRTRRPRKDHSQ